MTISYYDQTESFAGNQDVEITALYFRGGRQAHLESYPRRMVYQGREYNFLESGMQFLVRKGQELIRLFDVSDGDMLYRLRQEGDRWTLVNAKAA
ncbi:MAG: hypothetical protein JWN38_1128 [Candidatus Saccharibacteria bacterium]|nr:hypothetical protein [Candidatus Saccharibacteria bacterium]